MAKSGMSWFRLYVDFDDSFELVCAEYGSIGFEVLIRVQQKIRKNGYYCDWNYEVALLFAKKFSLGGNVVSEVIRCAVERGIFDKSVYEKYGILTSQTIQEEYLDSTERRKKVEIKKSYLLVDISQINENVYIIEENVDIKAKNVDISKQSRVEKSRVEKSRVEREDNGAKAPTHSRFTPPSLDEVEEYCKERKNSINAKRFIDYYTSKGWKVGNSTMRDWKATVRTWEGRETKGSKPQQPVADNERKYTESELNTLFGDISNPNEWGIG